MVERVKPYRTSVKYWLLVTDPSEYSYRDLERDTRTVWDGVTDYVDLKNLRDIDDGDMAIVVHGGDEPQAVGLAEIISDPYPDPEGDDPTIYVFDIQPERRLEQGLPLAGLQADPELRDLDLFDEPERSVAPLSSQQWERLLELSRMPVGERV